MLRPKLDLSLLNSRLTGAAVPLPRLVLLRPPLPYRLSRDTILA
jgi:hypothetical protein